MAQPLSLKGMIQRCHITDFGMLEGTVISEKPLKIQVTNDEKLVLDEDIIHVPQHLTDYEVKITFSGSLPRPAIIHNALKEGDKVHILSFNRGKQFYLLDRAPEESDE